MSTHILIVEDEIAIRDMIQFALQPAGFTIHAAGDVMHAKHCIANQLPHLILLDWMLPDQSGIEFTKELKRDLKSQNIPIILLTAKAEEENKVKGLEVGADDYITKPFSPRELIARIKTVLRRGPLITPDGFIKVKELLLNTEKRVLSIEDRIIDLTPIEYKLMQFFMMHQERIYTRTQLLDYVWGVQYDIDERTVDVQIRRLRNRLEPYGFDSYIKTIRGSGYQFTVNKA